MSRRDLAVALKWAARLGLSEGVCNHFSAVVAGKSSMLVNPLGQHWSESRPMDLVEVDLRTGEVLERAKKVETTAMNIHRGVHLHKPNALVVLHTHMPYATTLTCMLDMRLEMIHQNSLRFLDRIAYDDDYNGLALSLDEGERMARRLGPEKDILFLGNHGVIVCAPTVAEAFDDLYFLERSCQVQVLAASMQGKMRRTIDAKVAEMTARQLRSECPLQAKLHLEALGRILDKENSGWQTG